MGEKRKQLQGILRCCLLVLISFVFGFGIYRWNAKSLTGNVMPMPFGFGIGVVMSGSMEPELSVDDVIVVVEKQGYEIGDVVVFQQKNMLVVHKIISIDGEMVTTQGTANNTADEPMHESAIKGIVWFHIDGLGGMVTWVKSPLGTILILAVATLLLMWSYSSEKKEKTTEDEQLDIIRREIEKLKENLDTPSQPSAPQADEANPPTEPTRSDP